MAAYKTTTRFESSLRSGSGGVSIVGFSKFNTPHQVMIDHPIAKMGGVLNK